MGFQQTGCRRFRRETARKQARIRQDFPFAAIPAAFLLESEKQRRQGFLSPFVALRAGVKWICTEYNSIVIPLR
jgi:hypothetical protein